MQWTCISATSLALMRGLWAAPPSLFFALLAWERMCHAASVLAKTSWCRSVSSQAGECSWTGVGVPGCSMGSPPGHAGLIWRAQRGDLLLHCGGSSLPQSCFGCSTCQPMQHKIAPLDHAIPGTLTSRSCALESPPWYLFVSHPWACLSHLHGFSCEEEFQNLKRVKYKWISALRQKIHFVVRRKKNPAELHEPIQRSRTINHFVAIRDVSHAQTAASVP